MNKKTAILYLLLLGSFLGWSQSDTTKEQNINRSFLQTTNDSSTVRDPKKAGLYSALLPGLGQGYNRKYWKIPLIYGLGGFMAYQIVSNNREYISYRDELFQRDISSAYPEIQWSTTNADLENFSYQTIKTRKDLYRKRRDRMILFSSLFYALNIVDAVVDAHLSSFDIDRKRLVSVRPTIIPNTTSAGLGLNLKWRF